MQTFIFNGTTCCLENIDNNLIPNYQDEAAIVTAIQNGCLNEGQIVTTLSACDTVPLAGDACRVFANAPASGYVTLVGTSGGAYSCVYSSGMTYTLATDTLNTTNLTVTGCINGVCYSCYAQTCDIPDVSNYVTSTDLTTCLGDYVTATDLGTCCYATETCAQTIAEDCACDYFESCFADCFACCIAEWFDCHKGDINTADPGRDNSLWVI